MSTTELGNTFALSVSFWSKVAFMLQGIVVLYEARFKWNEIIYLIVSRTYQTSKVFPQPKILFNCWSLSDDDTLKAKNGLVVLKHLSDKISFFFFQFTRVFSAALELNVKLWEMSYKGVLGLLIPKLNHSESKISKRAWKSIALAMSGSKSFVKRRSHIS